MAAGLLSGASDLPLVLKLVVVMAILLLVHRFVSPGRRAGALMLMATIGLVAPLLNVAHLLAGGLTPSVDTADRSGATA